VEISLTKPVKQSVLFECIAMVMGKGVEKRSSVERKAEPPNSHLIPPATTTEGKVLVVEDNPINQIVAKRQLQKLGYNVDIAGSGLQAIEALSKGRYNFVLMDCQMPEMDGFDATAEIRRVEGAGKHTVIIAMTANALEEDRNLCLKAGMDDYISKPVSVGALSAVIKRQLG